MKINYKKTERLSKAGLAELRYKSVERPSRRQSVITLPSKDYEMYQLTEDFGQFLLISKEGKDPHRQGRFTHHKAWFGGTDEKPFLVELEDGNWPDVWRDEKFYDVIKPEIIKRYEDRYGKDKTLRQGDMFCYPLPVQNWERLHDILVVIMEDWHCDTDYHSLYSTRHWIEGKYNLRGEYAIGQGIISAPDHKPLKLKKICLIAQTERLKRPKQAD